MAKRYTQYFVVKTLTFLKQYHRYQRCLLLHSIMSTGTRHSCPKCRHTTAIRIAIIGLSNPSNCLPWSKTLQCCHCELTWGICCFTSCSLPVHKNIFYTRKQLLGHARFWHGQKNKVRSKAVLQDTNLHFPTPEIVEDMDADATFDNIVEDDVVLSTEKFKFVHRGTAQFAKWSIASNVVHATNCLVQEALLQSPVSLYMESSAQITPDAVQLFLQIAQLLVTTGQTHHKVLANILSLLIGLLTPSQRKVPMIPTTLAGFQSHILNPTNTHSLVSLLPAPTVSMLSDTCHAYCCLVKIAAYTLLLPPDSWCGPSSYAS